MPDLATSLEIAKVLISPAEKLIDATTSAIGKIYDPVHIRKMADAKAYEIRIISQEMREFSDIPIVYDKSNLLLNTSDYDEYIRRTQRRMAFQELTKQKNIESTVGQAYKLLEDKDKVPNDPVDADWLLRFFNSVQDISNVEMQHYWAKILAGEVVRPGALSLRTLMTLSQMSSSEAHLFMKVSKYALHCKNNPSTLPDDYFILNDDSLLDMIGISYSEIMYLNEIGLLSSEPFISVGISVMPHTVEYIMHYDKPMIKCQNHDGNPAKIRSTAYVFTSVGRELLCVLHTTSDEDLTEYFEKCRTLFGLNSLRENITLDLLKCSSAE